MASNTTQVPVEVKLQISNQAQVMRKLTNEFQDVFSNVDPGTAFGKKLAKAFSKIDNKLISAESLLGKDFFSESDMLRVTKYIESISEAMGEINTRAQSMSAKGLGLDTAEIEKAHQAVVDLQKTITEQKKAKVGSILSVDSKDFQELSALSSKSGFSGGKNFANNISAMNVSVGKLRQEWAELTNAAKEAEQAQQNALNTKVQANLKVNAAQTELDKRAKFNEDVAQQVAAVKLGGTKGRGIQQVISDYQQLLTEQLEGTDWKTGGFDFAQVIAGWLEVDPSELEGTATEVVQKLQLAIQEKLQKDALKKTNLLRSNAEAILGGQKDILNKDSGYTQRNQQAMEASAELQSASTTLDEANKNLLNVQTNAKNCEELLNKITAQIERLKELQKQYNDLVDEQNKEELDNARQREQQARRIAEGPTKEESQNIYKQTSENVKKTQQISAENVERNRIQKQHELEQEALERETEQFTSNLKQSIRQWMSAQQVINLIKQGIRQAYQDIQGLDKAMTNIAVVTDMSVSDLWGKINDYMSIAQQYGVTTQGVYEVSQLYYQQGLSTDEVMAATTETLKMARIAGMEYAEAADAMTVAIRAFKMEMSEAAHVTDVYSKVAAVTASDTEELAIAMSKTASSAESVGSSFENTTAMLAVMIETTRESAQNLGSALKSIISRYGEMKTGLTVDSEGELIDYNKVDTALKSVGISLKDTQGQFRDFDEVIFELSSKWDTLDKNTQRYIATVMAGNRQQSRFIALVDNWERLDEVSKSAEDSEDAGLLQYSKTLDSLETKINNIKTSFQQFYMDIFNGPLIGKGLEFINNIIKGFNKLGKLSSILNISSIIGAVKVISTVFVSNFANSFRQISNAWKGTLREMSTETSKSAKEHGLKWYQGFTEKNNQGKTISKKGGRVATGAMMAGSILSMVGSSVASRNQTAGAFLSAGGNALSIGAQLAMINPILGLVGGGIAGFVTLLTSLPSKMEKAQQELEKATEKANEANIKRAETKDRYNNLNEYLTKLENLEKTRYDSQENYDEWVKVNSQALEAFPELASTFDEANNAIVDLTTAENNLTQARLDAQKAAKEAADAQIAAALTNQKIKEEEQNDLTEWTQKTFGANTKDVFGQPQTDTYTISSKSINPELAESLKMMYGPYAVSPTKDWKDNIFNGYATSYLSTANRPFASAVWQYTNFEDSSDPKVFSTIMSLAGETDPDTFVEKLLSASSEDLGLKDGVTIDDFVNALTYGKYKSRSDFAAAFSTIPRDTYLSQKATENTVRAGIGTYLSSDFMWEDQDESFVGLANVNRVFQEALYKDFETFLKTGNKEITKESWKEWVDNNYNGAYAKLQKDYENFYKTLFSEGQIEDYNTFEQGSTTLTDIEYKTRLEEDFKVEDDLREEMVRQFTEEYNKAETEFKEALGNVEFLDEDYITNLLDDNSAFNFRQEYSDEIMAQARQLEKYADAGKITSEQAITYFDNYINIWKEIDSTSNQLNSDDLEKARELLADADLTTPEGIVQFYEQLAEIYEQAGAEIPDELEFKPNSTVNSLISSSMVNLNTSYQTLGETIATKVDIMADQLDKAKKGFDNLADVSEMVGKYGLSYADFTLNAETGHWTASQKVYDKIIEQERADIEAEKEVVTATQENQLETISKAQGYRDFYKFLKPQPGQDLAKYADIKESIFVPTIQIDEQDRINLNDILETNWDTYVEWYNSVNEKQRLNFYDWLAKRHEDQLIELTNQEEAFVEYQRKETSRQAAIDADKIWDKISLEDSRRYDAQNTLAQNYTKLTAEQIATINQDLGIDLNEWAKDNKDGTFDVSGFIDSDIFKNLLPETQNAIIASINAEFNAASEAISNLGTAAAGKADPGIYYEALKESGLSYDMLETLIPENIRLAAQGNKESEEALRNILKAANVEDADTVYNNIINNYFDATKANVFTALDSIEKALDGTLDAQELTELKTLDFGSYKIDFSTIKSSGELTLERYWETIRNGASETDWGQYFEKAAKRSFDSAFGLEELEFDKEVAEASGKFSQELITDIAKQAKQILSPDVLSKFFVYDKITETYSANIQAIMAEAKLTEAEARSQWALQASVLMGFDYNAVMASFAGQDYAKLIKTDSIESSLNELIAAPSDITLENIKSLYEEIHGAGTFVVSQDVATIDSFIQQAQEGAYDQIIGYIRNLYNEAILAGYDVDTSEITTLIQQFYENIARNLKSALSDGIEGNLDTTTYNDLVKKYSVSGIKTTTGYGLTDDSQQKIISEWYKAAQASGSILGFGEELWKTWADSAEAPLKSYRAISAEIEKAINKTDGLVSATDEYIAALQQARAAAYLDPNAYEFSFMEQDATGGLTENFDNFISQIDTVKTTLDSLKSGTAIGYQEFYNLIDFINNSGQWDTVSQKLGQGGKDIQEFANTIVETSGELGKVDAKGFAKVGLDMAASSEAMTEGMADGLKEVAEQQVNYLEGLESMLLAMQALSEVGDISLGLSLDVNGQSMDITLSQLEDFKAQLLEKYPIDKINYEINKALTSQASVINSAFEQNFGVENFDFMQLFFGGAFDFNDDTEVQIADALGTYISLLPNLTKDQAMSVGEQLFAAVGEGFIRDKQGNIIGINDSFQQLFTNFLKSFDASKISELSASAVREALGTAIEKTVEINGKDFTIKLGENGVPIVELPDDVIIDETNKKEFESVVAEALGLEQVSIDLDSLEIKGSSKNQDSDIDNTLEVEANISPELQVVLDLIKNNPTIAITLSDEAWALLEALQPETAKTLRQQAEETKAATEAIINQVTSSAIVTASLGDSQINVDSAEVDNAETEIKETNEELNQLDEKITSINIENQQIEEAKQALEDFRARINEVDGSTITVNYVIRPAQIPTISPVVNPMAVQFPHKMWTGNMNNITGSALADGNAIDKLLAGANLTNKTLVGELGPELAVYDGKYHMLGANGAEFVKLPSDAIVFNHLQTAGILNGQMNVRGQALAEGNVSGPALAGGGIDSALAAVRRAKAVWQGLLDNLTAAELAGAAGGGGGGGGDIKNHSEELQEWYNLSRQISNIEQEINNILAERENITEGDSYLRSLREQQKLLREQANIQEVLLGYQQLQLKRQADIINNDRLWSRFLEVDESGLLQYTKGNELNGGKGALQVLQEMNEMSGEEQVKFLEDIGYTYTTVDGDELKEGELVQKFYEELQKQIDDYDALYDTVHETKETLEGIDTSINEIDEEIKQNQMDLEEAIFDIIVEAWEKQIEQMEEYNNLVKEANDKYIDGLNDALEKEKELYSQNETIAEREQLQRRLSLLRRSGGSASEIASLEEQLDDKLKDEYFKNQEDAIKNIQEANDRQVELLEQQVKLQQDSLEYQKEHGVIWSQVYDIMSGSTEEILAFMQGRKPEFFNQSLLQQEEMLTDWAMKIGIYTEDRQYQNHETYARGSIWDNGNIFNNDQLKSLQGAFSGLTPEQQQQLQEYFSSVYATSRVGGADEATATQEAINALKRKMGDYSEQQGLASGSNSGKEEQKNNSGSGNKKPVSKYKFTYNGKEFSGFSNEASAKSKIEQLAQDYINKTLQYAGIPKGGPIQGKVSTYGSYGSYSGAIAAYNGIIRTANTHKGLAIGTIKPYSKGGLVDYTGLAMVHGSKSEPESFLNAEQTAQIREALILNGKTNALSDIISTLKNLTANIKSIVSNNYNNQATSFTVSPGAVVVQVAELNDAYDIEDISNDIMSRITTIAEKATKRGVNRR